MRNCGCNGRSDAIIGYIENDELFINGCVKSEDYDKDKIKLKQWMDEKESLISEHSEEIAENSNLISDLQKQIDDIKYIPAEITEFTVTPTTAEKGSSQSVIIRWDTNVISAVTLDAEIVTDKVVIRDNVKDDHTYTLEATGAKGEKSTRTASIRFWNNIYYGSASSTADVAKLNKVLSDTKGRTVTVTSSAGQYVLYALPKRLGTVTFTVNGFTGGFEEPETVQITNGSGYSEDYYVYRSTNDNLGKITVIVQ